MAATYSQEAIDMCRSLYLKYGGKNYDAIEREMQKAYPGWRKQNLVDKGRGGRAREGWVNRYGFDKSLELYLKIQTEAVLNDSQKLYLGVKQTREALQEKVVGKTASKDDLYAYRDFVKLEMEAKRELDLGRANFETFVDAWEKQLSWLPEFVSPSSLGELISSSEKLLERARLEYGESEGEDQSFDS